MLTHKFQRVIQLIESQWNSSGAWPDLVRYLRVALLPEEGSQADSQYLRLAELPALCCQAAGGVAEQADAVTAAWLCFYQAAHLMDSVQDQDEPEAWWAQAGTGVALNVASGLFFSAALILEQLHSNPGDGMAAAEIVPEFYRSLLSMCNGQQLELTCPEPGLEQYWRYAGEKSGTFFALACWAGARLASEEASKLQNMRKFGQHLGLIIQIRDDLEEFKPGHAWQKDRRQLARALPVVYAREVLPENERRRLDVALSAAPGDARAAGEATGLIDQSGASLYILAEIERHRFRAKQALSNAALENRVAAQLALLLESG